MRLRPWVRTVLTIVVLACATIAVGINEITVSSLLMEALLITVMIASAYLVLRDAQKGER